MRLCYFKWSLDWGVARIELAASKHKTGTPARFCLPVNNYTTCLCQCCMCLHELFGYLISIYLIRSCASTWSSENASTLFNVQTQVFNLLYVISGWQLACNDHIIAWSTIHLSITGTCWLSSLECSAWLFPDTEIWNSSNWSGLSTVQIPWGMKLVYIYILCCLYSC